MELIQRIMNDMHMKELTIAYGMTEPAQNLVIAYQPPH